MTASVQKSAAPARAVGAADAMPTWHGTLHGYTRNGCRQPCCKAAMAAYRRERRARARQLLVAGADVDVEHGTWSTYCNWGCRCGACKAAAVAYGQGRRRQKAVAA